MQNKTFHPVTFGPRSLACAAALLFAAIHPAGAQSYPHKSIRVVVPFAAAGSTDILIRTVGQKMSEVLGQALVIDNRGGAGGAIGAELAAHSPADGYTVMATTSGVVVVNPSLYKKLNYDPIRDFAPVSIIASLPNMLVVHPNAPVKNVQELIALAKAKPGQLTYASGGNGTSNHLAGELIKYLAKIDLTHVPYKGGGPAVLAVLSGEVTLLFATMPSAMPQVGAGRLKALAVTSRARQRRTLTTDDDRVGRQGFRRVDLDRSDGAARHAVGSHCAFEQIRDHGAEITRGRGAFAQRGLRTDRRHAAGDGRRHRQRNRNLGASHQGRRHSRRLGRLQRTGFASSCVCTR